MSYRSPLAAAFAWLAAALASPGQEVLVWRNPKPQGLDLNAVDFPARRYPDSGVGIAVGSSGTLIRTLDEGASWSRIPLATSAHLQDVNMVNDRTGYAVGSGGTVLKTLDGGLTWSVLATASSRHLLRSHFFSPDTGFVVGDSGTLLSTRDGGRSWRKDSVGSGPLRGIDFLDDRIGYIVGGEGDGILLKTEDGGETWRRLPFRGGYLTTVGRNIAFGRNTTEEPWKLGSVVELPDSTFNSNRVVPHVNSVRFRYSDACAAGSNSISVSGDGGATWRTTRLETSETLLDVRFLNDANTLVAVGSNGFLARSFDRGSTWTFSPDRFRGRIIRLQSLSAGIGYASVWDEVQGKSGLYRTRDDWRTLDYVDFKSQREIRSLHFPTDRIGYVASDSLFRTVDGGMTWKPIPLPFGAFPAYLAGAHFLNPDTGFLAEGRSDTGTVRLFKTSDGGRSWKAVLETGGYAIWKFRFLSASRGFAMSRDAIRTTSDAGETWTPLNPWQGEASDMDFIDERVGFVVNGDRVFRTRDGGSTWSAKIIPDFGDFRCIRFRSAEVGYLDAYGGGGGGGSQTGGRRILVTRDGGETWSPAHRGFVPTIWTIDISSEGQVFAAGEKGAILTLADEDDVASIRRSARRKTRTALPPSIFPRDILGRIRAKK